MIAHAGRSQAGACGETDDGTTRCWRIAAGGFATVHAAHHAVLDRPAAVKVLHAEHATAFHAPPTLTWAHCTEQ